MKKVTMGVQRLPFPQGVLLVGANVDGKPNFINVSAWSVANVKPLMYSITVGHSRYTLKGIRETLTFSINVPSHDLVRETDYCGIASGSEFNKVEVCQFKVFYGKLGNAPLIEQCPMSVECKVVHILDLDSHSLVVGRIEESHIAENCLTNGKPDANKIKPFHFISTPSYQYLALEKGEFLAKGLSIGKELIVKPILHPNPAAYPQNIP